MMMVMMMMMMCDYLRWCVFHFIAVSGTPLSLLVRCNIIIHCVP